VILCGGGRGFQSCEELGVLDRGVFVLFESGAGLPQEPNRGGAVCTGLPPSDTFSRIGTFRAIKEAIGLMVKRFPLIQLAFIVYFKRLIFIFLFLSLD